MIAESNPGLLQTAFGREIHGLVTPGKHWDAYRLWGGGLSTLKDPLQGQEELTRTMWQRLTAAAEEYNEPGRFTAFIGYEWTASPGGNNLHRNVVFPGGFDRRAPAHRPSATRPGVRPTMAV